MSNGDPAYKYIPKQKESAGSGGSRQPDEADHGTFTKISYATAWTFAILGSIAGLLLIVQSFDSRYGPEYETLFGGIIVIAASWISASTAGTLAEISRKLTKFHPKE